MRLSCPSLLPMSPTTILRSLSLAEDEIDSAITNLSKAIELNPHYVDAYYKRGVAYYTNDEFDTAIADFGKVIELNPDHANAYHYRGNTYALNREYGKAISDYDKAIELKPEHADSYYFRGEAHHLEDDYDKAIVDFTAAIELNSYFVADSHYLRGEAHHFKGEYDKAIVDFTTAIELNPNDPYAYYFRGDIHSLRGAFNEAIADFERAIELDTDYIDARIGVARAYLQRGDRYYQEKDYNGAIADFDRVITNSERILELDPNDASGKLLLRNTYIVRGISFYEKYEYGRALADLDRGIATSERFIELDPDNTYVIAALVDAHQMRGIVNFEQGDYDRALADFDRAIEASERIIELDPDNTENKFIRWETQNWIAKIEVELSEDIEWSPCESHLKCGFVEVPADYRNPDAGSIKIAVNVRRAIYQDGRIGYLLVNPGGPGISGLELVQDFRSAFADLLPTLFDIVGFDPRGVGASEPEFACGAPGEQLDLLNSIDGEIDTPEEMAIGEAAANLCIESMGPIGGLLHSEYVARDMDEIRRALGAEQVSYLGYSYGSTLGVWYATLFPESVRAMVVDGADNPVDKADTQQERVDEAVEEWAAFEDLMEQALAACDSEECPIYNEGDPIGYYKRAVEKLHLVNSAAGDVPDAGFLAVLTPLYGEELWPALWKGLYELNENDDPGILLEFAAIQLGDDLTAPNFTAHVNCLDGLVLYPELDRATRLDDSVVFDAVAEQKFPLIEAADSDSPSACPFYDQFAPAPLDGPLDGSGVPILVVGNHTDPATPFGESEELVTETLSNGYLLETSHASHVVYPDNDCVNDHVHSALIEAVYPDARVFCERED